ncbi:MAG: hypothetical protein JW994_07000, partial [Candidatus Omnitrophica bacterium]|nr:hypothetical protein [Candidatus Omnitrophota bacterium]
KGKVIIYSRNKANARILADLIKYESPDIDSNKLVRVSLNNLCEKEGVSSLNEAAEAEALIQYARSKEKLNAIIGLVKGRVSEAVALEDVCKRNKVPAIILGEKAFYSLEEAVREAAIISVTNGKNGWIFVLPPVRTISEELEDMRKEYNLRLEALQRA